MRRQKVYHWLQQSERRKRTLAGLKQPMTAEQLSAVTGLSMDACSAALVELSSHGIACCLNPSARRSRVYWLSGAGIQAQRTLREQNGDCRFKHDFPVVDWEVYGAVCFSHRRTIIRTLTRPMQPCQIKRKARFENPELRMSANNVRDIVPLLVRLGVLRRLAPRDGLHPSYGLTREGQAVQELLKRATSSIAT